MSVVRTLSWVELKLFLREPITVVFTLALPPLVLYVLAQAFGNTPPTTPMAGSARWASTRRPTSASSSPLSG